MEKKCGCLHNNNNNNMDENAIRLCSMIWSADHLPGNESLPYEWANGMSFTFSHPAWHPWRIIPAGTKTRRGSEANWAHNEATEPTPMRVIIWKRGKEVRDWNSVSWNELKCRYRHTFVLNSHLLSCFSRLCISVCVNDFKDDHYDGISDCNHVLFGPLSPSRSGLSNTYLSL